MGTSSVAGDPAWGSFGCPAERAAVEGWVIITARRTGRGDSAAEECPCLLLRCRRDPSKQLGPMAPLDAGLLTGEGERGARTPRLRLAPPHQNPWAQAGQWGGQSWDAGTQLELAGWVLWRAMPCQPCLVLPAGHRDAVLLAPGSPRQTQLQADGTPQLSKLPSGLSPVLGCSPLVRAVVAGAPLPGSDRGRAVTGAPADANAFAVSAGPAREAAWKKAQCWEPGRQRQEKQPPFGDAFQAANEINTARCRAARPHRAGQGAPAVHPCSPSSGETEAQLGAAWSWRAVRDRATGLTPRSPSPGRGKRRTWSSAVGRLMGTRHSAPGCG